MKRDTLTALVLVVVLAAFVAWQKGVLPALLVLSPAKVTAVVYVYEKDSGSVPTAVLTGLDKLNKQGVVATAFENDTVDGTGETPEQYKVPLAEAKRIGLPALVVMAGDKAVKSLTNPTTEAEVTGAAQ